MNYDVVASRFFKRRAKKWLAKHRDLQATFEAVIAALEDDPRSPSLRLHPLQGKMQGKWAVSVTHNDRIVLVIIWEEREITLLDIGTHDDVYE